MPLTRDAAGFDLARNAVVFAFRDVSPLPAAETRQDPAITRATVAGTLARLEVAEETRWQRARLWRLSKP